MRSLVPSLAARSGRSSAVLAAAVTSTLLGSVASAQTTPSFDPNAPADAPLRSSISAFTLAPDLGASGTHIGSAREAILTWVSGASGNVGDGTRWVGGVAPVGGDDLEFPAANNTIVNNTALTYGRVRFLGGSSAFSGGLNAYGMQFTSGTHTVSGGTYVLSSTQRGTDAAAPSVPPDGGFWALSVGTSTAAPTSATFSGTAITAPNAFVADAAGTTGTMTFTGANTTLTLEPIEHGRFGINYGTGTVQVLAGAKVSGARFVEIGRQSGSQGTLVIDGAGSEVAGGQVVFNRAGANNGTITVRNGGRLRTNVFGTIGSTLFMSGDFGAQSSLNILSGGLVEVTAGNLQAGNGVGTVSNVLVDAGTLNLVRTTTGGAAFFGLGASSQVNATFRNNAVLNATTAFHSSGEDSTSTVNLESGAKLNVQSAWIADGGDSVGDPAFSTAVVNVSGVGTEYNIALVTGVAGTGQLTIGVTGADSGTLNVLAGGKVTAANTFAGDRRLGSSPLAKAVIRVNGVGSVFNNANQFILEGASTSAAQLLIENGGTVNVGGSTFTGTDPGETALVSVTGAGSKFVGTGSAFFAGGSATSGSTEVVVNTGGQISAANVVFASTGSTNATATIDGVGSQVRGVRNTTANTGGDLIIAGDLNAIGNVTVRNGGNATADRSMFLATDTGSQATLNVQGGSVNVAAALVASGGGVDAIGEPVPAGTSTINVTAGGTVTTGGALIAADASGVSTLNVSGSNSRFATAPVAGSGNLFLSADVNTNGTLTVASGGTVDVANTFAVALEATSTAAVNVNAGGTLVVRGFEAAPAGTVAGTASFNVNGGTLTGGGTVITPAASTIAVNTGGRVAPGNAGAGTLTVRGGGATFAAGSTLELELASTSSFDKLVVGGPVTAGGSLDLRPLAGFTALPTDTFQVVTGSAVSGTFGTLNAWGLVTVNGGGAAFGVTYSATDVVLTNFVRAGDVDRSGGVNNQDIAPFVSLLTGGNATGAVGFAADVDGNGVVNNQDIAPFVSLLTGGRGLGELAGDPDFAPLVALVPEPGTLSLLAAAGVLALRRRRLA